MDHVVFENKKLAKASSDTLLLALALIFFAVAFLLLIIMVSQSYKVVSSPAAGAVRPTLDPIQKEARGVEATPIVWKRDGATWTLTPQAHYQISARVLGTKSYRFDWQAAVSPQDLALAWGDLSDPKADEWIRWRQSGRWYYYNWQEDAPYSGSYIRDHSANVHIIPATGNLARALQKIDVNDIVLLEGMLVDVETENGRRRVWAKTSLTRDDTGGGACEILYVQRLVLNEKTYR